MTAIGIAKRTRVRTVLSWRTLAFAATLVLTMVFASCRSLPNASPGPCVIEGPLHLAPRKLDQLHTGLSKAAVDRIMGAPSQSPAPGQYYYPTGGLCPLGDPADPLSAPCGLVANFMVRDAPDRSQVEEAGNLESCWWGPIIYGLGRE